VGSLFFFSTLDQRAVSIFRVTEFLSGGWKFSHPKDGSKTFLRNVESNNPTRCDNPAAHCMTARRENVDLARPHEWKTYQPPSAGDSCQSDILQSSGQAITFPDSMLPPVSRQLPASGKLYYAPTVITALKKEAVRSSSTSAPVYQTTRQGVTPNLTFSYQQSPVYCALCPHNKRLPSSCHKGIHGEQRYNSTHP
jgi:hypothetical protein